MPRKTEGFVVHEGVALIEVDDSVVLDALLVDRATARWIAARLSERVAVVTPGAQDALVERLRLQGHLPNVLS